MGSATAIRGTVELILAAQQGSGPNVVIVSAVGSKPRKVTDLLLDGAQAAVSGDRDTVATITTKLIEVHDEIIDDLFVAGPERETVRAEIAQHLERYSALCEAVLLLGELTPQALDVMSGVGEQMSARIVAAFLCQERHPAEAIDATEIIVTDNMFQQATPLLAQTRDRAIARLGPVLNRGAIPVVTGFIAATANGATTTLGRGGSDFSAAIIGRALAAREVWIWTDVDGVLTADPRLVAGAQSIPELTYREVSELAYYGASVLHPKTIRPCIENGIPLRIKNTFNPTHPGTVIVEDERLFQGALKAVTAIKDVSMLTVEGKGMIGVPGIAARTFGAVASLDVSVLLISQASSEQSICFVVPEAAAGPVTASLEAAFAAELARRDIERIWALTNIAIVTIVGAGIQTTPGIAGRIFSALGDGLVNVVGIAQGSSECSISLIVAGEDVVRAVSCIHEIIVPVV